MGDLEEYLSVSEISRFHKLLIQLRLGRVSINHVMTLDPVEIAKKTHVSASAVVNLRGCIVAALFEKKRQEKEMVRKDAVRLRKLLDNLWEERDKENGGNYRKYLRLAPDENGKRKNSEELDEEEMEVVEVVEMLGDDKRMPQSMKKHKRQRVKVSSYEEARAQHDQIMAATVAPQSTCRISFQEAGQEVYNRWRTIRLLDSRLTRALSGGIAPGYITEVCGESGCGKTQLMMHLLLAVQLPAPIGLSKPALYLSTESSLPTKRVRQLLAEHPLLSEGTPGPHPQTGTGIWPSLDNIYTQEINSLEVQERVMETMVPLLIKRKNIGLIVVDSLTGNYRQEFSNPEISFKQNMIRRAKTMRKMGALLRQYAKCGVAVVVVNQVSDRFKREQDERNYAPSSTAALDALPAEPGQHGTPGMIGHNTNPSAIPNRLLGYAPPIHAPRTEVPDEEYERNIALQEQFFSGWGDDQYDTKNMKNPWGGLAWTKQLSCRIALIKRLDREANDGSWKRWAKVVFCAWSPNSGIGLRHKAVEYKITSGGIQSCKKKFAKPQTPPLLAEDPYGMEDPAVQEAFLELERNWPYQHPNMLDEKQEAAVQIQELKMQEPILMTQRPIEVRATHITFDETGQNVVNEVLTMPRLSPTSGVGNWNRRTGSASQAVVAERRLFVDEVPDTQADDEELETQPAIVDAYHLPIPPMMGPTRNGVPDSHPDSSDSEDELPKDNAKKDNAEEPPPRRFGSEVPDSQAESEDESDYEHMFVEKNSVERQWEADHHVEEAVHIQITDSVEPEDNFLHLHSSQEIQAREARVAEEEKEREQQSSESPTLVPKSAGSISHAPVAAVKAMFTRDLNDKGKFGRPPPLFTADKENFDPRAVKIGGFVSADGGRIAEPRKHDPIRPPDDAVLPTRPHGEAIRTGEERVNEVAEETTSMPTTTQLDESTSKKEKRAAKKARKEAKKAAKKPKAGSDWSQTPENRRFKECLEKYPFFPTRQAHDKALKDPNNRGEGVKSQLIGAYELMCVRRAKEHNLTLLDWPIAQTPEGEYIDVETGFLMTKEAAEPLIGQGDVGSPVATYFSPMSFSRRAEPIEEGGDDDENTYSATPSRQRSGTTPSSAQPRASMQPKSPPRKETPILPPKTWSQRQAEKKKSPAILPDAKPPSLPASSILPGAKPPSLSPPTPSLARVVSNPQSSGPRKESPILPGMKPPSSTLAPVPVEVTVRKVTPVLPPSSPLPVIPDVPSMKRMKKRLPGSQLKNVTNSSDAIDPLRVDGGRAKSQSVEVVRGSQLKNVMNSPDVIEPPQSNDGRAKSNSVEVVFDQENMPRSSVPLRSSPPLSMPPPATQPARVQALSPSKARARYSPQQRKRSQLQETYNHSSQSNDGNEQSHEPHHCSDFEDISQEDPPVVQEERPRDPAPTILPGMKATKPLPVYKTPTQSHKKKEKAVVTPATPLRPDQLPREDDIDYDAFFPSQESQESPKKENQVFITKQGVRYPASKPVDFYGTPKIVGGVQYPPTKGQRDAAEEAEKIRNEVHAHSVRKIMKDVQYPPTKGQRDAAEAEEAERIRTEAHAHSVKKRVVFKNPPIRALDAPTADDDDEGEDMADILNFTALGTPRKRQQQGGFLPLTSSPHRPSTSAPAKTFHATSISNATISRQPKYSKKPSKRWKEAQKEFFEDMPPPPQGSFEAVVPSSQPEADEIAVEGDRSLHMDVVEIPMNGHNAWKPAFKTTASDDEYGFDAEMLEAMNEVVVSTATTPSLTQKRQRQESPTKEGLDNSSAKKRVRSGDRPPNAQPRAPQAMGLDGAMSPHRAGAQRTMSRETSIHVPSSDRERTTKLFDKVKTAKAQGFTYPPPPQLSSQNGYVDPMGIYRPPLPQHGGPSREFLVIKRKSSGVTTQSRGGSRTWRPDDERPMPSIERDEADIIWETNALREQAEREMTEAKEREERARENLAKGIADPSWLYRDQEKEEAGEEGYDYDRAMG